MDKIKNAVSTIANAIGEQDAKNAEIAGAALFLIEQVVTDINRIADSLETLDRCAGADGIHPSAFRVIRQD